MEIVLQWLDDLDDAVFAALLGWERLRHRCLLVNFLASSALASCVLAALEWVPLLGGIAAAGLIAALGGAVLAVLADRTGASARRA